MIAALRYELTRIRTIRSTWWISALAVGLGILIAGLLAWATWWEQRYGEGVSAKDLHELGPMIVTQLAATGQVPSLVSYLLAMLGIFAWGHEYRHGMIRASLTALNSRTALWLAKYAVVAVWAVGVAIVTMVGSILISLIFLGDRAGRLVNADVFAAMGKTLLYAVVLAWLAMAFTAITRSQAFAMVTLFLWPMLIEPLCAVFFLAVPGMDKHIELTRFLPFNAGTQLLNVMGDATSTFGNPLSALGGAIIFGGVAAVLMVASFLLFGRRDA